MTLTNTDAVYAEYPFLTKILPRRKARNVLVTRWDEEFLSTTPAVAEWGHDACRRMYFIDKDGKIVTRVGGLRRVLTLGTRFERVDQALARIGSEKARRVYYAVFCPEVKMVDVEAEKRGGYPSLILYKVPQGFESAGDWQHSIIKKERESLRQDEPSVQ